MKRRTLLDLYVEGTELTIDDGRGGVTVWLQKLNPVEHETVIRKAAAARASMLAYQADPESEDYKLSMGDAIDFGGREPLIEFLVNDEMVEREQSIEARLEAESEEWSENNYLQGLHDRWLDELKERYALDEADEEAVRVLNELKRFNEQVQVELESERVHVHRDFETADLNELRTKAVAKFLARRADQAFMAEYQIYELYLAVRFPEDHRKRYFSTRSELDHLSPDVKSALQDGYYQIAVEPAEGKGSQGTPASSPSSEPSEVAVEVPSGPTEALL